MTGASFARRLLQEYGLAGALCLDMFDCWTSMKQVRYKKFFLSETLFDEV